MKVLSKQMGLSALALSFCLASAWAATPEETQAQLQAIQQTLSQSNAKVSAIASALAEALKAQDDISADLVTLGKTRAEQQAAIASSAHKIKTLEIQSVTQASDLAVRQDELSDLLAGLQRLQQNPPPALVVKPENVLEALRGAMMFGAVVPEIRDQARDLKAKLEDLRAIRSETQTEKQRLETSLTQLATSETELITLQQQKKAFATAAAQNLAAEKLNTAVLADKARDLQQLLLELQKARDIAEARKSAEAKAAAAAAAKAEAERLAALQNPHLPLSSLKGKLSYPAQGILIRGFGQDNGLGSPLEGLALATSARANVSAPLDGKVEFAGPFRSYGQLLILNAGEGYLVLLAGMNQISAEIGQSVKAGEPVGTMGEGPSTLSLLGDDADHKQPIIYIEFRKDNAPVDSTPWWEAGQKEAVK